MGTEILNIRAFAYMEPYGSMYGNPDHVISSPPPNGGGSKTKGSNTIMSTLFAFEFWSNKIIDVDIILSITLTVS